MSEYTTANTGGPELCVGIMEADEKGKVTIPPQYAYRIEFNDNDCLVIPLEDKNKKRVTKQKTTRDNEEGMTH